MNSSKKLTSPDYLAIKATLSAPRIGTYEQAMPSSAKLKNVLELYSWNAQISSALLTPLHICEVAIRNAVSEALTFRYGNNWPWVIGFHNSLPNSGKFKVKDYVKSLTTLYPLSVGMTTGKLIPEFKFVFWEKMFTARFDLDIWSKYLHIVMPNIDQSKKYQNSRLDIANNLQKIRSLRNRIAHHEPIFHRDTKDDFEIIKKLISLRCKSTEQWMISNQNASHLISIKKSILNPESYCRLKIKSLRSKRG